MQPAEQPADPIFATNDLPLTTGRIAELENAQAFIRLFGDLHYNVDDAANVGYTALGFSGDDLGLQIKELWRIGADPDLGDIVIYLFVVKSVTMGLVQRIARQFRTRPELPLIVLTVDYEQLVFVLLDRLLIDRVQDKQPRNSPAANFKQVIRPRTLLVKRRAPSSLAVRVLRRFTCTEGDSDLQWEKLRSAYTLAEWSEEYFNNRALFSDYYLKHRLTNPALSPAWAADVRPVGGELAKLVPDARKQFAGRSEADLRRGFFEPIFKLLGFDFTPVTGAPGGAGDTDGSQPDYYLHAPGGAPGGAAGDGAGALAAVLTYTWNRNLDAADPVRDEETPNEIPGALVVSTLERGRVPWVITTNGKLWRLYAAAADNKATNYYEVDLEEAFSAPDRVTALKYWWLFFRRQAFGGFLDDLRRFSADYAKDLGQRLKDRVFEQIFPHFAAGLIAALRARGEEIDLPLVFQGALTFLYRLMFVAYAESLDLLPLYEAGGYGEVSLHKLKKEVADAGGDLEDEAPKRLQKAYSPAAAGLYERLQTLFGAIDAGSTALNLPTYNGGLFAAESAAGSLLARCPIPDRYLALGLDRLCRDVDDKTQALVMIDFKSLGVRQLGSIYEGLLEFTLQIAGEKLAVVREDGREVYLPAAKAKGRSTLAALEQGDVYLQNDKAERKATGSYYTPDYIVKYIVEHTVGPVIERKFRDLEPRLRAAQKGYRDARKVAAAKGEDPEKFWNSEEMAALADACLDIKVLDPAMGSGHFLVEAVDFISDRLIVWLNGWSENPVWALLDRTRRDILADMDRQGVTIPAERLVRVALLKRAVLKRCIYGVDLNAMAVELAKVSLWLDAFTLGAPLSFLDHHLKEGNSLIGSRIAEVQAALHDAKASLFASSKFAGVMLATDLMRRVSYLSDTTPAQVQDSRSAFRDAGDHLAPFKRVLDVYTSRWFGNAPTRKGFEPVVEFLQRGDVQAWLEHPTPDALPANDYMNAAQVAATALAAAADKRFFHWELEFPEVFFAPSKPGGQDVQLREHAGFDAVVGNPPYLPTEQIADELRKLLTVRFPLEGKYETSVPFTWAALSLNSTNGFVGMITPVVWQTGVNYERYRRELLLSGYQPRIVVNLPFNTFPDAYIDTGIQVLSRRGESRPINLLNYLKDESLSDISDSDPRWQSIPVEHVAEEPGNRLYSDLNQYTIRRRLRSDPQYTPLGQLTLSCQGIVESFYKYSDVQSASYPNLYLNIDAYRYEWTVTEAKYIDMLSSDSLYGFYSQPRILIRRIVNRANRLMAVVAKTSFVVKKDLNPFVLREGVMISLQYLLSIINSSLLSFLYTGGSTASVRDDYRQTTLGELNVLPIWVPILAASDNRKDHEFEDIQGHLSGPELASLDAAMQVFSQYLVAGETDIIHDLLAFLAEQMIDLNRRKQAEVKRFLAWLEGRLAILPRNGAGGIDSLTGKSILQNYLGDYQKGEAELPWDDFFYRLHQNRTRLRVSPADVKGEIEAEYTASLAALRPLKRQLALTDALIDKIVYRLYGLTPAEIEIIERPQYEQALAEAKQAAAGDKSLPDDERADLLADRTLAAGRRLQERVDLAADAATLDAALPGVEWISGDARTFLLGAEFDLRTRPDQLDFAPTVLAYSKAVEQMLGERLFARFRRDSGAAAADCRNEFLQKYMNGGKPPTLAAMGDILRSGKETALRAFGERIYLDAAARIFGAEGVAGLLAERSAVDLRNRAAHDTVLTRADALQMREWALAILRLL